MLYKNKGQKNDTKNYRPITLLNQFGKIFEKSMEQKIRSWAEENNKINLEQSGFRKKDLQTTNYFFQLKKFLTPSTEKVV